MKLEKRPAQVGEIVMLGTPRLRPGYLQGSLWEVVAHETDFVYEAKLVRFQVRPPRNAAFWLGCKSKLRMEYLVGVATEQEAAA